MMLRLQNNQRGLTLIEIMLAIVILGIIAVPIFALFTGSFMNILTLGERSEASTLASSTFVNLRALVAESDDGLTESEIRGHLVDNGFSETACEDLDGAENGDGFFCLKASTGETSGTIVTLKLFYRSGRGNVTLTTFIRGDED